jgi:hypothetical protein
MFSVRHLVDKSLRKRGPEFSTIVLKEKIKQEGFSHQAE